MSNILIFISGFIFGIILSNLVKNKFIKKNDFDNFRNHKPVTSPTPPPSPQSYWTGKPVVPESIRKSNRYKHIFIIKGEIKDE